MRAAFWSLSLLFCALGTDARRKSKSGGDAQSLYEVAGTVGIGGEPVDLSKFAGSVALVVNVASY